jgi:hypothetical protein
MGVLHQLHPVATLSPEELVTSGIPAGIDMLPEHCVTLHEVLLAVVSARITELTADVEATKAAALVELRTTLVERLAPETFAWQDPLLISLREAHTYARRLLRCLARIARLDAQCAASVVSQLAGESNVALERTEDRLASHDEIRLLKGNLRGLLITLKRRRMLPSLCFRLERRPCQQLAMSLCFELDRLEFDYRRSPEFQKLVDAIKRKRKELENKLKAASAQSKDEDNEHGNDEVEIQEQLNALPSVDGVDARFAFLNARAGGPLSVEELQSALGNKRLRPTDLEYEPMHPSKGWKQRALQRGIAYHHAGAGRKYRRAVETLFRQGRLSVVFCTSTLALGINMPCRSVVFVGDSPRLHRMAYRQMAGRAGRRGFDNRGNVIFMGVPATKVNKLVTCSVPRLLGSQVMQPSTVVRMSLQHHAAKLDVESFGELETEVAGTEDAAVETDVVSRRLRSRETTRLYPGGELYAALPAAEAELAMDNAVARTQRVVECGMVSHRAQSDFTENGVVAKRDAGQFITADDVDTDAEDEDEGSAAPAAAAAASSAGATLSDGGTKRRGTKSRGVFRSVVVDGASAGHNGRVAVIKDLSVEAANAEAKKPGVRVQEEVAKPAQVYFDAAAGDRVAIQRVEDGEIEEASEAGAADAAAGHKKGAKHGGKHGAKHGGHKQGKKGGHKQGKKGTEAAAAAASAFVPSSHLATREELDEEELGEASAWSRAPRLSSRLAFAFVQRHLVETGALTAAGTPRGLAGFISTMFSCGEGVPVFASLLNSGLLPAYACELDSMKRDDCHIKLLELTACFFGRVPATEQLVSVKQMIDAGATEGADSTFTAETGTARLHQLILDSRKALPPSMQRFLSQWNSTARVGYSRYLRAAAAGFDHELPLSSVLPLTGAVAGSTRQAAVAASATFRSIVEADDAAREAVAAEEAEATAQAAAAAPEGDAAAPGEVPDEGSEPDWDAEIEEPAADEEDEEDWDADIEEEDGAPGAAAGGNGEEEEWDAGLEEEAEAAAKAAAADAKEEAAARAAAAEAAAAPTQRVPSGSAIGATATTPAVALGRPSTLLEAAKRSSIDVVLRSPCAAVAGLGDSFVSVDELVLAARPGLRPDVAGVPVFDESGSLLNNYAVDFFVSKNKTALHERNLLDDQIVYGLIESFAITLRRISFSLKYIVQAERALKHAEDSPGGARLLQLELLDTQYRQLGQRYWDRFKRYIDKDTTWIKQHDRDL